MTKVVKLFLMAVMACLSACGSDKKVDYLDAHNGKLLVVSSPLTGKQLDKGYVLPNVGKVSPPELAPPV